MIAVWWTSLTVAMKILWAVTLSASLVFIIQSILTFVGADSGDSGLDGDFDTDSGSDMDADTGMNLLTFRNLVNFCLGFGWTAILMQNEINSVGLLLTLSAIAGILLVVIVMYLFKWLGSMQQSGNINVMTSAKGCNGKVYIPVPGARAGYGKVQVTINNSVREYDAVTDSDDTLKTGTDIVVVEAINDNTLLVEELNSLII